jgi:O-antigen ligase
MTFSPKKLLWLAVPLVGCFFAWRLQKIPSRLEVSAFFTFFFIIPALKWPKFAVYYLFTIPLFIPMGRRMYYLINGRPTVDYLMLIGDGVMIGFIASLILLWTNHKERVHDKLTVLILLYSFLLLIKVFFLNEGTIETGLYGFKFNGLYVLFYFAGSYVLFQSQQIIKAIHIGSIALFLSALWSLKQITLGFSDFEQRWLDSITFTTLRINGVVRPFGTYVSPAALADGMCILVLLGVFYIFYKKNLSPIWGLGLVSVAVIPLLIATVRTSWIGVLAGLFLYAFFLRIEKKWIRNLVILFFIIAVSSMMLKGNGKNEDKSKLSGKANLADIMIRNRTSALANPLQEYSIQKRMQIWGEIWYFAVRKPLGRGQGTHGYAHSYYFQILGEIGFPGILAFLGILFFGFRYGFAILRMNPNKTQAELARLMLSMLFMFSILNLTGTHLHTNPGDIYFWFSLGTLAQLHREVKASWRQAPSLP